MLEKKSILGNIAFYVALAAVLFFALFPFAQMISVSFKSPVEYGSTSLIPQYATWEHYEDILSLQKVTGENFSLDNLPVNERRMIERLPDGHPKKQEIVEKYLSTSDIFPFLQFFRNSFLISFGAAFCALIFAIFSSYAIARLRFFGQVAMQRGILFVYMIGGTLLMVPLYQIAMALGLTQTKAGMVFCIILIYLMQTLPVAVYMLGNYFRTISFSLEEAAAVDGYSRIEAIFKVVLPISVPMLITVFIYCFIIAWNEYLFVSIFFKNAKELYTLPIGLKELYNSMNSPWGRIMSASVLTTLPVVILFSLAMKFMTGGLSEGGVKE